MEDAGQLAYLRTSMRECGFDKKMRANPARCGTLDRSVDFLLVHVANLCCKSSSVEFEIWESMYQC